MVQQAQISDRLQVSISQLQNALYRSQNSFEEMVELVVRMPKVSQPYITIIQQPVYRIVDHAQYYSRWLLSCDNLHHSIIIINPMSSHTIALNFYKNATPDFIEKISYKKLCKYDAFSLFLDDGDKIGFQQTISLVKQSLRLKDEKIAQETLAVYKKNETIAYQASAIVTLNKTLMLRYQHIDQLNLTIAYQRQSIIKHNQTIAYQKQVINTRQTPFFLKSQFLLAYFFSLIILILVTLLLGWTQYSSDRKAYSFSAPFFIAVIYSIVWIILTLTSIVLAIKQRKVSNRSKVGKYE